MHRFASTCLALAATTTLLTGCSSSSDPGSAPTSSQAQALPDPVAGRLTRILGNGRALELTASTPAPAARSGVSKPRSLVALDDDTLLGTQQQLPTVFRLSTRGVVHPSPVIDGSGSNVIEGEVLGYDRPALAGSVAGDRVLEVFGDGAVKVARIGDARVVGSTTVPGLPSGRTVDAASLFGAGGDLRLVVAGRWFTVAGLDAAKPTVTRAAAPVAGAVVAAPARSGTTALTEDRVVGIDAAGKVVSSRPWKLPQVERGESVTSAISDGQDGLLVTVTRPTGRTSQSIGGAVLRVARDGSVETIAQGRPPETSSPGCDDADRPVEDAHLAQPSSLARWGDRLVVADVGCGSLLQMPFPGAGR